MAYSNQTTSCKTVYCKFENRCKKIKIDCYDPKSDLSKITEALHKAFGADEQLKHLLQNNYVTMQILDSAINCTAYFKKWIIFMIPNCVL